MSGLSAGKTCVHRLHPLVKILATAVFVVTVVSFDRYALGPLMPFIFYPMLLTALSETPNRILLKKILIALLFCLFAGISNIIFDRTAAFALCGITISNGVISFIVILFKTYLCVMAVLILVSTTLFSDLAKEMRRLRIPDVFITMFEMTYRYIGVLPAEAYSMSLAYSLRSPNGKGIQIRDMGGFAGQLLIRSFDRAGRVYNAMKCRGYALQKTRQKPKKTGVKGYYFFISVSILCITIRAIDMNRLFIKIAERLK